MAIRDREQDVWDQVVERIELDATDADFAEAERALRGVEAERVRPELVEAVVARARGEVAEAQPVAAAPARVRAMPRMRRVAAAAAAMLWGSKVSAATTATVVALVAVGVLWNGIRSREMSDLQVFRILVTGGKSEGDERAAVREVTMRIMYAVETLQQIRDDPESTPDIAKAAREGLAELKLRVDSSLPPLPSTVDGTVDIKTAGHNCVDMARSEPERLFWLRTAVTLAANGLSAMHGVHSESDQLRIDRDSYLRSLRILLSK